MLQVSVAMTNPHPFHLLRQMKQRAATPAREPLASDPPTLWFDQRLDHFQGADTRMWKQRYFVNATLFDGTGPVFVCVGGEGPGFEPTVVVTGGIHCAWMIHLAERHNALIVAIEHRYYGNSYPVPDLTDENMVYVSSHQALADIAAIHAGLSKEYSLTPSVNKWFTFGGSYPGMMAAWMRLKYPHLIHASIASSNPVHAQVNFQGYNDVVGQSMAAPIAGGSTACLSVIQQAYVALGQLLQDSNGVREVEKRFNVCGGPGVLDNEDNVYQFMQGASTGLFGVQENDPNCQEPICNIQKQCAYLLDASNGAAPLDRIVNLSNLTYQGQCIDSSYQQALQQMMNTTWAGGQDARVWFYQTCTQFGYFQTCDPGSQCPFTTSPHVNNIDQWNRLCTEVFKIQPVTIYQNVDQSNLFSGSDHPAGSRVAFVNGQIDPWHYLSITKQYSKDLPTIWVPGASHHAWTHPLTPQDSVYLTEARATIGKYVAEWLKVPCDHC